MHIEWKIEKKRGNYRPKLSWKISLDEYEKNLALGSVEVESTLPKPPEEWEGFCYPGHNERVANWKAQAFYSLSTPCHKNKELEGSVRLPWREDNLYPEIEQSFDLLRGVFEQALRAAYDSLPLETGQQMNSSAPMKKHIASDLAAQRLLRAVGQ